ncbi:unnamed protein product [Rotaria sordida]|uniref:GAIN-B domain-containing protein n=1 Tax=Rotaria sordida TaxID=392033 RepID=A0A814YMB2_9BILA|nr:unnamed protein product [Rotaria sordida]CAF3894398.1 unnamed protein product [Rotaria sordida]
MIWTNGTCVTREFAQTSAILTIYSNSSNDTEKADALAIYVTSISNSNVTSNSSNILTIAQIDQIVGNLTNDNYTVNTNDTIFIMTRPNLKPDGENKIGASFQKNIGGTTIYIDNKDNVTNSNLSAAGIITLKSLNEVKSFNMIIIYDSTAFENADNSSNKTLSSSIIFATINGAYLNRTNITITLYFQVLKPPKPTEDVTYLCTFYDTNTLKWNEFGCTVPRYNRTFDRYECQCNHLTSFALIWLPKSLGSSQGIPRAIYNNQDKASIAFQIISIFCFILVVMHGIGIQFFKPQKFIKLRLLLPLISCIVTMILFIFYIALGLTVYSRFSQSNVTNGNFPNQGRSFQENSNEISLLETKLNSRVDSSSDNSSPSHIPCLPNEHALMFIVFFFIIFMFGVKTSFGYYNYRYYVQLNPPPSVRSLVITIGISFLIGIIYMAIAAGLNSNPSNEISEIYVGKLCWFNRRVIHYFLTIPICIFLLISIILIIWVTKRMIAHINRAEESTSEHTRKKYCLIVVLTSCVTQGLGWLFGPLILIADPKAGEVLGWFFVIFNGLEGVWIIILYIIARKEHMGEKMRARDYTDMQLTDMREETPEPERDDQNINRTAALLKSCKSDSPRNSFVDLSAINIYHRAYPDDNDQ